MSKRTTRQVSKETEIEQRRRKVAAALLSHRTQREIATALGIGLGTVNRDVKAIQKAWQEQYTRDFGERVAEELAKLDLMEQAMLAKVIGTNPSGWAVDRILAIMNHRARLLGLYAPERHEVITIDTIEAEIEKLEAALAGNDDASALDAPSDAHA